VPAPYPGDDAEEPEARNKIFVPQELIGLVVGNKGRTIKAITKLSEAKFMNLIEVGLSQCQ